MDFLVAHTTRNDACATALQHRTHLGPTGRACIGNATRVGPRRIDFFRPFVILNTVRIDNRYRLCTDRLLRAAPPVILPLLETYRCKNHRLLPVARS